ncbi:MAG TPA: HEAT repeat domain-containing protein [Kofleriaceae bacterium]|nr:HEAT repeat domain-containing protein [Kofleriaceae bacterium]
MRRRGLIWAYLAAATLPALALAPATVQAQPADVPGMIKFVEQKPDDLDRSEWKEKRRDVAKKLGASKDKRATAVLSKLADEETFDIVGEIAIEGLGQLGDANAAPVLQKIAADVSREKRQRELATKALAKLGVKAGVTPPVKEPIKEPVKEPVKEPFKEPVKEPVKEPAVAPPVSDPPTEVAVVAPTGVGADLLGEQVPATLGPAFAADTLAASDRVTFALGTASLGYDSVRKRTSFDFDVAASYQRRVEQEKLAYGYGGAAHVVAGYLNPDGPQKSRGALVNISGNGEVRIYGGPGLYGVGRGAAALNVTYLSVTPNDPNNDPYKDVRTAADLGIALGGGFGRVLDVGSRLRVTKLEDVLRRNRVLGKPIDATVMEQLQRLWWGQRHARNAHQLLITTIAALRSAGVILGEPDASVTYQLLAVLRDGQLNNRMRGFDIDLTFGESYLLRDDEPNNPMVDKGRVEQLLLRAGYGRQLSDKLDATGTAWGRLRVLAADNTPSPWAVGASARARRFTYGDFGDPIGTLDLTGTLAISNDDTDNTSLGFSLGAELGFTYWLNQASGLRLAATTAFDSGDVFVGAKLEATYGLLDGSFAR